MQSNDDDDNQVEWIARITKYLWIVVSPALLSVGTVGNILSIVVLSRRNLRGSQASLYLIALSLTDIVVLYSGLLRQFLRKAVPLDVRHISEFGCKLNIMMVYSSLDISVWILVAFTFERILSVYVPHKIRTYCTRVSSCLVIGIIVFAFLVLNCHFLFGFGNVKLSITANRTHVLPCYPMNAEYTHFVRTAWPWIDFSVFNLVPCLVFIVGNTCIAVKVLASRRRAKRVGPNDALVTQNMMVIGSARGGGNSAMQVSSSRPNKTSSMTAILVLLNFLFLATTTPVSVYFIVESKWLSEAKTRVDHALIELTFTVVNLIMYMNNATNFILYCITGSRFRRELKFMFLNKHNRVHPEGNDDANNRTLHRGVHQQRTVSTTLAQAAQDDYNDTRL